MRFRTALQVAALLSAGCHSSLPGEAPEVERGLHPLFNGRDLEGWVPVNTAPSTWTVEDGILHCSGRPTGELRTERMYQNFELEVEWRHLVPGGNAGIFVWADDVTARGVPFHRSIEVQVLENDYGNTENYTTHGDIFPIHGARMTPINGRGGSRAFPTEALSKPSPQWNHYRITCLDGAITLAVNGTVVTRGVECSPRKGYICLESEGGVVDYRALRIRELPARPLEPELVATPDRGYRSLYTGVDLSGWLPAGAGEGAWRSNDWILSHTGSDSALGSALWTVESFGDFGFLFDVRVPENAEAGRLLLRGPARAPVNLDPGDPLYAGRFEAGWNRFEGTLIGDRLSLTLNGEPVLTDERIQGLPDSGPLRIEPRGRLDLANLFVRAIDGAR